MSFKARYHTACAAHCGTDIYPGDEAEAVETMAGMLYTHPGCVGDIESRGADFSTDKPGRTPGIPVLPRGKTARDRCDACFQVPASNGQCGCF